MKPTRTPVCLRRREEPLMDLSDSERYLNITRGTRVHSVIFVMSLKLIFFPFSASILTFSNNIYGKNGLYQNG